MRNWTAPLGAAAAFAAVFVLMPEAQAQSLFQKIFGFGNQPQQSLQMEPPSRRVIPQHRFHDRGVRRMVQPRPQQDTDDDIGPPDSGGPYKTLCVRTCDGFYFPLRYNARRKNFASDAKSCKNACGSEARLFYHSVNGPEGPDAMVDLAGRKYSAMPHALAYRKALVQGCSCKPVPWAVEEAARHQSYADRETAELAKDAAAVAMRAESVTDSEAQAKSDGRQAQSGNSSQPEFESVVAPSDAAGPQAPSVVTSNPTTMVDEAAEFDGFSDAPRNHAATSAANAQAPENICFAGAVQADDCPAAEAVADRWRQAKVFLEK